MTKRTIHLEVEKHQVMISHHKDKTTSSSERKKGTRKREFEGAFERAAQRSPVAEGNWKPMDPRNLKLFSKSQTRAPKADESVDRGKEHFFIF